MAQRIILCVDDDELVLSGWGEVDDMGEDLLKDWREMLDKWDGRDKTRPSKLINSCRKVHTCTHNYIHVRVHVHVDPLFGQHPVIGSVLISGVVLYTSPCNWDHNGLIHEVVTSMRVSIGILLSYYSI